MGFYSNHIDYSFSARIENIVVIEGKTCLILDKSDFYPGGGGQVPDRGYIDKIEVTDVFELEGIKYHELANNGDFFVGMRVIATIDKEYRLEVSRQHTGQHLLSAVLDNDYGIKTLSFHMGKEINSIDTDKIVTSEVRDEVIIKVGRIILRGLEVERHYTNSFELEKLGLRKLIEAEGEIQLIKIGDIDYSACCGTHVDNTRDLILPLIKSIENYKGGSRIHFSFGKSARDYLYEIQKAFEDVRASLGVHESEVPFRIKMNLESEEELKRTVKDMRQKLVDYMAESESYRKEFIYEELDEDEELIKLLAEKLLSSEKRGLLVDLNELRFYGFGQGNGVNLGKVFKENKGPKIRGGGGPKSFQGVSDSKEELLDFTRTFKNTLEEIFSL